VVNVVTGFGETACAAHEAVDKVAFTASTEACKLVVH
jgi:acyl-CoA reductase-like NAD-dependent aldehyde dehydrogenase